LAGFACGHAIREGDAYSTHTQVAAERHFYAPKT
jgi:hypothetical protein